MPGRETWGVRKDQGAPLDGCQHHHLHTQSGLLERHGQEEDIHEYYVEDDDDCFEKAEGYREGDVSIIINMKMIMMTKN